MNYFLSGSILGMLCTQLLCAQSNESSGARATGMGHAAVTLCDEWASFYNVAGLASQRTYGAGISYANAYAVQSFRKASVHLTGPLGKGGAAFSFYKSGNELYAFNRISFGYASKISLVRLGLQMHYVQASMEGQGVRKNLVLEFGGIAELLPERLFFGAAMYNFNQAKFQGELLPVVMKAGISYRPGKKLMLNGEVEKDLLYPVTTKLGLEYALLPKFSIRTGINTRPVVHFFGVGIQNHLLKLDYAISFHPSLGYAHRISLTFSFPTLK